MPVITVLLALSLGTAPPAAPPRLDPTDIEALEALLRAMDAQDSAGAPAADDADPDPARSGAAQEDEAPAEAAQEAEEDAEEAAPETPAPAARQPATLAPAGPAPASSAERAAPSADVTALAPRRMTPHVGMEHYERVRGAPLGEALALDWAVSVRPLDEAGAPDADAAPENDGDSSTRRFFAGEGWAGETAGEGTWLYDFTARRILTLDEDGATHTNTSLYAAVRRNVDIYVALSRAGEAEEIAFGPSTRFHRFWLEAAMTVAANPAGLTETTRPAGGEDGGTVTSWYRQDEAAPVASAWTGCEGVSLSGGQHHSLMTGLAHRLALHPDIFIALRDQAEPVCALSFTIISPDSPQGRTEHWRLAEVSPLDADALGFAGSSLQVGESPLVRPATRDSILSALRGELGDPPSPPDFMVEIQRLRDADDYAGAMLTLVQETAHFGLCPAETIGSERLACAGATALAEAGAGNDGFDAVAEAMEAAADGAPRAAIERLLPYLEREDYAGSAARTVIARQLVEWGEEGLAAHPALDPAGLLSEALVIDPFAVNIYWYLALRYMAAGAPDEAWLFLDAGRALPGRQPTETLDQARSLERRLEQLAPALVFPSAAQ